METEAIRLRWNDYVQAWSDVGVEERKRLLQNSVAVSCVYTDPIAQCHGHAELIAHIEGFQKGLPGGRFETEAFIMHHDHALIGWHPVDANGVAQASGLDAVIFDAEGWLVQITGFAVTLPPER